MPPRTVEAQLKMGTEFDEFSMAVHHGNDGISTLAQRNRMILLGLMTVALWDFYAKEWWHYQLFESRQVPLLSDPAAGTCVIAVSTKLGNA